MILLNGANPLFQDWSLGPTARDNEAEEPKHCNHLTQDQETIKVALPPPATTPTLSFFLVHRKERGNGELESNLVVVGFWQEAFGSSYREAMLFLYSQIK